jgi:hypothetical protein
VLKHPPTVLEETSMNESTRQNQERTALPTTRRNVVALGTLAVTPSIASARSTTTDDPPRDVDGLEFSPEKQFSATSGVFRAEGELAEFNTPIGPTPPVPDLYVRYVNGESSPRVFISHSDGAEYVTAGVALSAADLRGVGEQLIALSQREDVTPEWVVDGQAPRARIETNFAAAGIGDPVNAADGTSGKLSVYGVHYNGEAAALGIRVSSGGAEELIKGTSLLSPAPARRAGRYMVAVADDVEATGRER